MVSSLDLRKSVYQLINNFRDCWLVGLFLFIFKVFCKSGCCR